MITKIHICEIHMTDREHIQTLLTVAKRYWLEQATQAEIAAEIGYSRSMVSRLLDEARRRGIITFTVQHPLQRAIELEQDLTRTFGLACARVAMSDDDSAAHEVSRMASDLVTTYMHPDSVIALSNGRGVASVARGNLLLDSPELCRQLAERLGCAYRVMPAPVLVSNPQVAAALKAEKSIGMTIAMASHADILVTGVGAVGVNSVAPIFDHVMPERAHAELLSGSGRPHLWAPHRCSGPSRRCGLLPRVDDDTDRPNPINHPRHRQRFRSRKGPGFGCDPSRRSGNGSGNRHRNCEGCARSSWLRLV